MAWATGDPGIIFIDRMNRDNPTPRARRDRVDEPVRRAAAAAVRGVQPRLGQPVAVRRRSARTGPAVDWDRLADVVHRGVRFLDNVIDVNEYPLAEDRRARARQPQDRPRRHGLGGHAHQDGHRLRLATRRSRSARRSWASSRPRRKSASREAGRGARRRSRTSRARSTTRPRAGAMRNATVTTIAPTGTLSIIANCSVGHRAAVRGQLRAHGHGQRPAHRGQPDLRGRRGQAGLLQPRADGR